jgi:hypothetical protein
VHSDDGTVEKEITDEIMFDGNSESESWINNVDYFFNEDEENDNNQNGTVMIDADDGMIF